MKKVQLILSYYTLIAATVVIIWAIFSGFKSQSLLIALAFVPTGLYFWLIVTGVFKAREETQTSESSKTGLIILVVLLTSSISTIFYSFLISRQSVQTQTSLKNINSEIRMLDKKLDKLNSSISKIPSQKSDDTIAQELKIIKNRLSSIETKDEILGVATVSGSALKE